MNESHPSNRRASDRCAPAPAGAGGALAVDLRDVIYALSAALDLVGVDDVGHGKRVGIMAADCARRMDATEDEAAFLFDLGILHDIGVSSTAAHSHLVAEFDWENSQAHCEAGYRLLRDFAPLAPLALPIRHHHTRWEQLVQRADIEVTTARQANLVLLVDRVDAFAAPYYADGSLLLNVGRIREQIRRRAGTYFAPDLVDGFLDTSASEAFWLQLEPRGIEAVMRAMRHGQAPCQATFAELKQLAAIFSRIVDAKSPFTTEHSLGVARLARFIAERMGIGQERCDKIEIAGLLHDLGKLRVPDEILDKPGPLDERERKMINAHSFETFLILRDIRGFEDIALWAAHHHEEPDGSGYPFRVRGDALPLEARILRVADIFQAMVQKRPYRQGLSRNAVLSFMEGLATNGRVDADVVAVLARDIDATMRVALPGAATPPGPAQ